MLVFRDQPLSLEALDAFGRRFGAPHIHPATPGAEGFPALLPVHTDADSKTYAGSMWHSDVSCDPEPPMGSILHLHEVPDTGGDTLFANMYAAWDALSDPMKRLLEGLSAVNASAHHFGGYFGYKGHEASGNPFPESVHPVVRTHPETGRKALYVNETFTTRIVELQPDESKAVLALLYRHLAAPRFQCRVRWRPGTTVMCGTTAAPSTTRCGTTTLGRARVTATRLRASARDKRTPGGAGSSLRLRVLLSQSPRVTGPGRFRFPRNTSRAGHSIKAFSFSPASLPANIDTSRPLIIVLPHDPSFRSELRRQASPG